MTVHEKLQSLFKFVLQSKEGIPAYLQKMDRIGKLDSKHVNEIVTFLCVRVAQLEENEAQRSDLSLRVYQLEQAKVEAPQPEPLELVKIDGTKPTREELQKMKFLNLRALCRQGGISTDLKDTKEMLIEKLLQA